MKNKNIEILVRAIIQRKGRILLCKNKKKNFYYFPGGHLEFGESAKEALARELKEELGLKIKKCNFIGGSEHRFVENGKKHHEINLVFETKVNKLNTKSKENHLQFFLIDKNKLAETNILPIILRNAISKWLKAPEGPRPFFERSGAYGAGKKPFWISQIK